MEGKCVFVLTNSNDATSDYLCSKLIESGVTFLRFNTDNDLKETKYEFSESQHYIEWNCQQLTPQDISAIIYRRPKPIVLPKNHDEFYNRHITFEWSEVLEGFLSHIPLHLWINHPSLNYLASHKIEQLNRAKQYGLETPKSVVTNQPEVARQFLIDLKGCAIVKPLASGYIERNTPEDDTLIYTRKFTLKNLPLLDKIDECPVLFQQHINKAKDVRVTVIDEKIIAIGMTAIDNSNEQVLDIRCDNMKNVVYTKLSVPKNIEMSILSLMKSYKLRFGALDFAITPKGQWVFFEINPNGQWAWLDQCADAKISDIYVKSLKTI
jgi:hypothetical protein